MPVLNKIAIYLSVCLLFLSCNKEKAPKATIVVMDIDNEPSRGLPVRFYLPNQGASKLSLDTTIFTGASGIATLEYPYEAYVLAELKYVYYGSFFGTETSASLIPGRHFVDTLYIHARADEVSAIP
jgi:hypothetical protein